jgi:hypothetical protein
MDTIDYSIIGNSGLEFPETTEENCNRFLSRQPASSRDVNVPATRLLSKTRPRHLEQWIELVWRWFPVARLSYLGTIFWRFKDFNFYLLTYVVYMRTYRDAEKLVSIFRRIYIFSAIVHTKNYFRNAVSLYVCMHEPIAGSKTVRRILCIFGMYEFIHHRSVPGEYEYSRSKTRSPSVWPPKIKRWFSIKRL